ncbi:MAG: hypothetical protein ACP5UO_01730 [Thermoplasmata archaeon]
MKEFHNFSLKEGSRVKVVLRSGDESITIDGEFKGLSDTLQPLLYVSSGKKSYLVNMLDIIYIETEEELEEVESSKKTDYLF